MDGIRFSIITYPGYISLPPKKPLLLQKNGVGAGISVDEHIEALTITDYRNSVKSAGDGSYRLTSPIEIISNLSIAVNYNIGDASTPRTCIYEYALPREKTISTEFFSVIAISYEVSDPDDITKEEEDFSAVLLSEFLQVYKVLARDSRVRLPNEISNGRLIEKVAVHRYSDEEKRLPWDDRLLAGRNLEIGVKRLTALKPKESVPQSPAQTEQNYQSLQSFLYLGAKLNDEFKFLSKAHEEVDINRNYKYALLESFIVAESAISESLRKLKLAKGVSKSKLNDYETEVSISYQINVEMPILLDNITPEERQVLGGVDGIRKIRNDVVHNGADVDENTALNALNWVSKLITMLAERNLI